MTRPTWNLDHGPFRGFYRDRENGWLFGVCAGIADRFNLNLLAVRVVAIICLIAFSWLTVLLYCAAVLLIREKPLVYSGRDNENEFWRRHRDQWRHS
jgi:phage shock protein PspC (stress-responsive transcriptional regulator)